MGLRDWLIRRVLKHYLEDNMDRFLALIPSGYGTKTVGALALIVSVGSLAASAFGMSIPGVQLSHDAAMQTITTALTGLFLHRKMNGGK